MIVGFIGLGTMGAPMARNILTKGNQVVVCDVVPAAVAALTAAGATAAATPREVAERSEMVITMLPDSPDVERVARQEQAALRKNQRRNDRGYGEPSLGSKSFPPLAEGPSLSTDKDLSLVLAT